MGLNMSDYVLVLLFSYFILMNVTVERFYCDGSVAMDKDTRFLMPETYAFCSQHNKLFLSRPEWMIRATCVSAWVFLCGYLFMMYTTVTGAWKRNALPVTLFIGAKAYGIFFYHYMEFSHPTLAPAADSLVPYFSVEGPYIVAMGIVLFKVATALNESGASSKAKRN
jgi:hypothetical protein